MTKELIITNGDSAADLLRAAYGNCVVLPWRDVLHEGPVPFTKELPQTVRNFKDRDDALQETYKFDRVVLWKQQRKNIRLSPQ